MPRTESTPLSPSGAQSALLAKIERVLETCRARIDDEVKNYPRPITACDVQFDYALEQQASVREELRHAAALRDDVAEHGEFARAVGEFVSTSAFIDTATAREIAASLESLPQADASAG